MSLEMIAFERRIKDRLRHLAANGETKINIECHNCDISKKIEKHSYQRTQHDAERETDRVHENGSPAD